MINKITHSPGVGYSGKVTYKVLKDNKVFSQKTLHNTGTLNLFTALCRSLAGLKTQEAFPAKVQLFSKNSSDTDDTLMELGTGVALPKGLTEGEALTVPLLYSNTPIIEMQTESNGMLLPTVTFQFVIPYTLITNPASICYAVLFPNKANIALTDALAWLDLTEGGTKQIEAPDIKENVQFLVSWTMKFDNLAKR